MKRNKKEQFIKLAESRINKAATMLWCVGNLSNKMLYEYDEQDVERIFSYLQEKLNEAKQRFENAKQGRKKFSLSDEIENEIPPTEYPNLLLDLPNGAKFRAKAIKDEYSPAIKVELIQDGKVEVVCEVEYNIENESPKDVGVCLYAVDYEDQVDYFLFKEREEK